MTRAEKARLLLRCAKQLLYPRRCPFCGEVIGFAPQCAECAPKLGTLLLTPTRRLDRETHYFGDLDGAAAAFRYEGCMREAILRMKYADAADTGPDLGNLLAKELFQCTFSSKYGILVPERALFAFGGFDVVVPVPASDKKRGYNPPFLLTQPVAKALEIPSEPKALRRVHFRRHQAGLNLRERLVNVAGAFKAESALVEGRRILLVDDVITTGATTAACAQALLAAGAQSVSAVALAAAMREKKTAPNEKTFEAGRTAAAGQSDRDDERTNENGTERYRH